MDSTKRKVNSDDEEKNGSDSKKLCQQNGDKVETCSCNIVKRQEEEICRLKAMLKDQEVQIQAKNLEDKLEQHKKFLEDKLENLFKMIQDKKEPAKAPAVATFSIDSLHNKVDKLVRLMSETVETQTKMSKAFEAFVKSGKPKPPPTSMTAVIKHLQDEKKKEEQPPKEPVKEDDDVSYLIERQKMDDGLAELRWGLNLLLLGDDLWRSFLKVDDVSVTIRKMEHHFNLKMNCRSHEVLSKLYDQRRDQILFALPPKTYRVAISVGAHELITSPSLLTLREATLEEVRKKNRPHLVEKAGLLKGMTKKLLSLNKHVLLVIPPHGTQRVEIFRQWEEIVLEEMEDLLAGNVKILNLPDLVRSSLPDFKSQEDHLNTWFSDLSLATLSHYGTRRLLDALKRTIRARASVGLNDMALCLRCSRKHAGGSDTCRSIDRMCRHCGIVGHFHEIHSVADPMLRMQITSFLGYNVFEPTVGCEPDPALLQNQLRTEWSAPTSSSGYNNW